MGSEQLVMIVLAVLLVLVLAMAGALLLITVRASDAALSINSDWREVQRFRLEQDRAEFLLREQRSLATAGTPDVKMPRVRGPRTGEDISTGPLE